MIILVVIQHTKKTKRIQTVIHKSKSKVMAGCFGNHPVDRWMEKQLEDYLVSQGDEDTYYCEWCDADFNEESCEWQFSTNEYVCPECGCVVRKNP